MFNFSLRVAMRTSFPLPTNVAAENWMWCLRQNKSIVTDLAVNSGGEKKKIKKPPTDSTARPRLSQKVQSSGDFECVKRGICKQAPVNLGNEATFYNQNASAVLRQVLPFILHFCYQTVAGLNQSFQIRLCYAPMCSKL